MDTVLQDEQRSQEIKLDSFNKNMYNETIERDRPLPENRLVNLKTTHKKKEFSDNEG